MKIYFLLIFLSLSFFAQSQMQTFNSSCVPTAYEKAVYWNDAYLLATKHVNDLSLPCKDSVLIPSIYIDSIAEALYAMQNMDFSPIQDTIISLFGCSKFVFGGFDSLHMTSAGGDFNYGYSLKSILIVVSNKTNWETDWAAGNYNNTANDSVNYLMNTFGLQVSTNTYQLYSDSTIYIVSSAVALNSPALVKQFAVLSGVTEARTEYNVGSGQYMDAYILDGYIYLTYNYGCGDCPSGCTYGREWQFKINPADCSVSYIYENDWGNFIQWITQGSCFDGIVPVEFTGIQAFEKNNTNVIQWQIAMETDVADYVVQRSTDGINYSPIGEVQAKNNPSASPVYSFTDDNFMSSNVYYRIELINNSGTVKYSSVVKLSGKTNSFITAYPSLLTGNALNIQFNKVDREVYFINLVNTSGQKLFSSQIKATAETFTQQLLLPLKLPRGVYTLSVIGQKAQLNQLIVVP